MEDIEINIIEEVESSGSGSGGDGGSSSSDSNNSSDQVTYTVRQGDTLSGIGEKFGVSWRSIANDNKSIISDPNVISIGWQLVINNPAKKPIVSSDSTGDVAYDRYMRDFPSYDGGFDSTHPY
jgi:LysM repeat protein